MTYYYDLREEGWTIDYDDPSIEIRDDSKLSRDAFLARADKELDYSKSSLNRIINITKTLLSDDPVFEPITKKANYMQKQLNLSLTCEQSEKYKTIPRTALKTQTTNHVTNFLRAHSNFGELVNQTKDSLTDVSQREKLDKLIVLHKRMKIVQIKNALKNTYDYDEDDVSDYEE
jgi:hypothetical protein